MDRIETLHRVEDAAAMIGIPSDSILRLIADGDMRYCVIGERGRGKGLRIPNTEIDRLKTLGAVLPATASESPCCDILEPEYLVDPLPTGVYFVAGGGLIKIGVSRKNMRGRIEGLQSSCPVRLSLVLALNGDADLEAKMHGRFHADRAHGEWFRPSAGLLRFVLSSGGILPAWLARN